MDASLQSLLNLYAFTTGRRLFALGQVRAIAAGQGFTELVQHCDAARTHDLATVDIERRWSGETARGPTNPVAQRIDGLIDATLGAIRDQAVSQTRGARPDDPIHGQVAAFVKRLFPVSVHAVTTLPHIDELAAVDAIVTQLQGELAPAVTDLGLGRLTKRLADLAGEFRNALEAPPASLISWGHVRAARDDGQGLLLEAVAIILGRHHGRTPEATAERLTLLAPILRQNEAIAQYLRARRTVSDVNPETGEEDPGAPGGKESPSGGEA